MNKYSAERAKSGGITFASKAEARRYLQLKAMQQAGEISDLTLQPVFQLGCGDRPILLRSKGYPNGRVARYVADFSYRHNGIEIVEDVKGMDTPLSRLKRAIVEAQHGVVVRVVR